MLQPRRGPLSNSLIASDGRMVAVLSPCGMQRPPGCNVINQTVLQSFCLAFVPVPCATLSHACYSTGEWFRYGNVTGLRSPVRSLTQLLNDQLYDTAHGWRSAEHVDCGRAADPAHPERGPGWTATDANRIEGGDLRNPKKTQGLKPPTAAPRRAALREQLRAYLENRIGQSEWLAAVHAIRDAMTIPSPPPGRGRRRSEAKGQGLTVEDHGRTTAGKTGGSTQ